MPRPCWQNRIKEEKDKLKAFFPEPDAVIHKAYPFMRSPFLRTAVICMVFILFPASTCFAISIPQEKKLGEKFMEMVEKRQMILNDPIADHMIDAVGSHLLSLLPPQPFDFTFNLVDENVFNAFAAPGSNIFVYRGLITSLDNIDELAGIIGHEIAHAVSRHVSESIDRAKYINIGSLAGMLAGVIIGSQTDGEAGAAVMHGSMAAGTTAMLAYTRENETEADEKGIMFLKQSCFSPEGLQSGLIKIRESDFRGVESIPDYVKTHPGTTQRIAHVETILSGYVPEKNKNKCSEDFRFDMVKYRLLGLYADIRPTRELLETKIESSPSDPAVLYGLGLLYARKLEMEKALSHLQKALSINVFDPMILLEIGRINLLNGEAEKAVTVLEGVKSEPILGIMARFHLGEACLEMNNLDTAKNYLEDVIDKKPEIFPKAYFHMADIMTREQNQGLSHFYLGQYYYRLKNIKNAKVHFNRALNTIDSEDYRKKTQEMLKKIADQEKEDKKPADPV